MTPHPPSQRSGEASRGVATTFIRWLLASNDIEPAGRIRHARRCEVVVNGGRAGSGLAAEALRVKIDRDEVSARSRRVEPYRRRVAALPDRQLQADTVGVKHVAPIPLAREEGVEVAGRDRLSDSEGVVAGWRRDLHPVKKFRGLTR